MASARLRLGQRIALQRHALVHRSGRHQPGDGIDLSDLVADPAEQLGPYFLGGAGGHDGPFHLAAGIGKGGPHGVEAVKPQSL